MLYMFHVIIPWKFKLDLKETYEAYKKHQIVFSCMRIRMSLADKWIVEVGHRNPTNTLLETLEADKSLVTSEAWPVSLLWNGA